MIFVDTSFFFALFFQGDDDHARVKTEFEGLRGQTLPDLLLTTNHVVFETITLTRVRAGHDLAVHVGRRLLSGRLARVHQASADEERDAFEYFSRFRDQKYSAVDCLSFIVMEALGIQEALTVDSDFTHRFVARPGPT